MSESEEPDHVEVEEALEEKNVFVVDPEDYQKTRKLKAINDAKKHYRELQKDKPNTASKEEWRGIHGRMAEAVAMYGSELLPLIDDAIDQGVLEEEDLEKPPGSLREFIFCDGKLSNEDTSKVETVEPIVYKMFYRELNRIERKLGLGLELEEDQGPAEI